MEEEAAGAGEDENLETEIAIEDHPEEVVHEEPDYDIPSDDEPDFPVPAEEDAVHVIDDGAVDEDTAEADLDESAAADVQRDEP